jgi:hypothetical protein
MKIMTTPLALAPVSTNAASAGVTAYCDSSRAAMSAWAAPVQGIAMSAPAQLLGNVAGVTTVTATAAKGANRKRTTGDEAFEDPV